MADNITKPLFWAEMFIEEFQDEKSSSLWGGSISLDNKNKKKYNI